MDSTSAWEAAMAVWIISSQSPYQSELQLALKTSSGCGRISQREGRGRRVTNFWNKISLIVQRGELEFCIPQLEGISLIAQTIAYINRPVAPGCTGYGGNHQWQAHSALAAHSTPPVCVVPHPFWTGWWHFRLEPDPEYSHLLASRARRLAATARWRTSNLLDYILEKLNRRSCALGSWLCNQGSAGQERSN